MLFDSDEPTVWEAVLAQYPEALAHHVSHKKDDSLLALDQWYQDTLPTLLQSRQPMHIDSNELCQLMSWKLKVSTIQLITSSPSASWDYPS